MLCNLPTLQFLSILFFCFIFHALNHMCPLFLYLLCVALFVVSFLTARSVYEVRTFEVLARVLEDLHTLQTDYAPLMTCFTLDPTVPIVIRRTHRVGPCLRSLLQLDLFCSSYPTFRLICLMRAVDKSSWDMLHFRNRNIRGSFLSHSIVWALPQGLPELRDLLRVLRGSRFGCRSRCPGFF